MVDPYSDAQINQVQPIRAVKKFQAGILCASNQIPKCSGNFSIALKYAPQKTQQDIG